MSDDVIDLDDGTYSAALDISLHYQRRAQRTRDHAGPSYEAGKPWKDAMAAIVDWETKASHWGQIAFNRWIESPEYEV